MIDLWMLCIPKIYIWGIFIVTYSQNDAFSEVSGQLQKPGPQTGNQCEIRDFIRAQSKIR